MPLRFVKAPLAVAGVLPQLSDLLAQSPVSSADEGQQANYTLQAAGPIPIHPIERGRGSPRIPTTGSRPTGWRYLIVRGGAVKATADVVKAEEGLSLGGLSVALAGAWGEALEKAELLLEVQRRTYRIHALVDAPLGLVSLWLRGGSRAGDILSIVGPAFWPFEAGQWYPEAWFSERLKIARRSRGARLRRRAAPILPRLRPSPA